MLRICLGTVGLTGDDTVVWAVANALAKMPDVKVAVITTAGWRRLPELPDNVIKFDAPDVDMGVLIAAFSDIDILKGAGPVAMLKSVKPILREIAPRVAKTLLQMLKEFKPNCVAFNQMLGFMVGGLYIDNPAIKSIGLDPFLVAAPGAVIPSSFLPPWIENVPFLYYPTHRLMEVALNQLFTKSAIELIREAHGVAACPDFSPQQVNRRHLAQIVGLDKIFLAAGARQTKNFHYVGNIVLPTPATPLPADLEEFIQKNANFAFLTSGSMPLQADKVKLLVKWLAEYGLSVVVFEGNSDAQAGLTQLKQEFPSSSTFLIPRTQFVRYSNIINRAKVAITHFGSGTSYDVARSGVPGIGVIFMGDQKVWATKYARALMGGLSGKSGRPADLIFQASTLTVADAAKFKRALDFATSPQAIQQAQSMANSMSNDGAEQAAQLIVQILKEAGTAHLPKP